MYDISPIKLKELQRVANCSAPLLSRKFKNITDSELIERKNNRISAIHPKLAEDYLLESGIDSYSRGCVVMLANLCGGCSKTSGTIALGAAISRITNSPIFYIDGDSQGSLTEMMTGSPAKDEEPILIDYLEEKKSLREITNKVEGVKNTYLIRSNLNNAHLDRVIHSPSLIKKSMLRLFQDIFKEHGENTKIFIDFPPQLSNIFSSAVVGLSQLKIDVLKTILIPLRSDNFSINGGQRIITEYKDILETFGLKENIKIHTYFSSVDRRIKATGEAMRIVVSSEELSKFLSPIAIRYSSEIIRAISLNSTIFKNPKGTASVDYQDLLEYVFLGNEEGDFN